MFHLSVAAAAAGAGRHPRVVIRRSCGANNTSGELVGMAAEHSAEAPVKSVCHAAAGLYGERHRLARLARRALVLPAPRSW